MAGYDMAAEPASTEHGPLQIDLRAGRETAQRGAAQGLGHGVRRKVSLARSHRQADPVDRYAVSHSRTFQHLGRLDVEHRPGPTRADSAYRAYFLYYSREHNSECFDANPCRSQSQPEGTTDSITTGAAWSIRPKPSPPTNPFAVLPPTIFGATNT